MTQEVLHEAEVGAFVGRRNHTHDGACRIDVARAGALAELADAAYVAGEPLSTSRVANCCKLRGFESCPGDENQRGAPRCRGDENEFPVWGQDVGARSFVYAAGLTRSRQS